MEQNTIHFELAVTYFTCLFWLFLRFIMKSWCVDQNVLNLESSGSCHPAAGTVDMYHHAQQQLADCWVSFFFFFFSWFCFVLLFLANNYPYLKFCFTFSIFLTWTQGSEGELCFDSFSSITSFWKFSEKYSKYSKFVNYGICYTRYIFNILFS